MSNYNLKLVLLMCIVLIGQNNRKLVQMLYLKKDQVIKHGI